MDLVLRLYQYNTVLRVFSVATQSDDDQLIMMSRYLQVQANWTNNGQTEASE